MRVNWMVQCTYGRINLQLNKHVKITLKSNLGYFFPSSPYLFSQGRTLISMNVVNNKYRYTFARMKYRITAVLLIFCIISCSFSRFFIYAGFDMNRSYIAAKLCENRSRPWLHCNGHCYLMKKLKQADEKQATNEREAQKNLVQETFFQAPGQVKFFTHVIRVLSIPNNRIQLPQGHGSIFQPPQLG